MVWLPRCPCMLARRQNGAQAASEASKVQGLSLQRVSWRSLVHTRHRPMVRQCEHESPTSGEGSKMRLACGERSRTRLAYGLRSRTRLTCSERSRTRLACGERKRMCLPCRERRRTCLACRERRRLRLTYSERGLKQHSTHSRSKK